MDYMLHLTVCMSFGILLGFIISFFLLKRKKAYSDERYLTFHKKLSATVGYITAFILIEGLLWCGYFLLLAVMDSSQVEYATNMSQLIVSVLTVVSIIFAFIEFTRRKKG